MYELKTSSVLVFFLKKKKENKQNEIKKLKLKKNIFKKIFIYFQEKKIVTESAPSSLLTFLT